MNEEMSADGKHRGLGTRIKELFGVSEIEEDYEEFDETTDGAKKRPVTLRLQSPKVNHVAVRQPQSFDDARIAADGLKEGRQQIVNLERTPQDLAERIIDFLNGVTYALNGFVEPVGERVYLFAPSNTVIDVPEDLHKSTPGLFDRNL
jgi:cell division inhibitor SepF